MICLYTLYLSLNSLVYSLHLYHMLPNAKVGQLASYRTLLIKNKHLAILAQRFELQKYIIKSATDSETHEPQLSSPSTGLLTSSPAMPVDTTAQDALEAVLGAVYLDAGLSSAQRLIAQLFFPEKVCALQYSHLLYVQ